MSLNPAFERELADAFRDKPRLERQFKNRDWTDFSISLD